MHSRWSKREGHVLLSLALMRTTTVDKDARLLRAQGGALNDDVDKAGATVPMHCPMGTYPGTGIGGLVLGGGIGFLSRKQGLSIDCLHEVELVTADGQVLRANETQHSELFWAMRGAGYNFGVVTEFVLRIQPVGHQTRSLTAADEAIISKHGLPVQEQLEHKIVRATLPYPQAHFAKIAQTLQSQYIEPGQHGPLADRDLSVGTVMVNSPMGPLALAIFVHTGDVLHAHAALDHYVDLLGPPLQPLSEAVHVETYFELQNSLVPLLGPGHHHDRAFFAINFSEQLATAAQLSFDSLAQYPGMEGTSILFLVSGVGSAIADNVGRTAFSDEQRRGNVFIHVLSQSDREKLSRAKTLEWCNNTREALLPHCNASYTNTYTAQVSVVSLTHYRIPHCSASMSPLSSVSHPSFVSPTHAHFGSLLLVCCVVVARLCCIVRRQSAATASVETEVGPDQPLLQQPERCAGQHGRQCGEECTAQPGVT